MKKILYKKYKDLSVKVKIPFLMGVASFAVFVLVYSLLSIPLRSISMKGSTTIARLTAMETGDRLSVQINGTANIIRTFSGIVSELSSSKLVSDNKKRELLLMELEILFKSRSGKKLNTLWCVLEPNILDGMDSLYINRIGSNSKGVFAPWFTEDKLIVTDDDELEHYYILPKETRREVITDLYWDDVNGKQIQMFSICIPLFSDDEFIGVIGTDIHVDEVIELISDLNHDYSGYLVSDKGIIMAHNDSKRMGQLVGYGNHEILDRFSDGKIIEGIFDLNGDNKKSYKVFVPIHFSELNNPWFYTVEVPIEKINANARQTSFYIIFYCLVGVLLITLLGWLLINPMLKEIINITGIIRKLSLGHIDLHIEDSRNNDEIGKMKTELHWLLDGLKSTADFAQNVGKGNFDAEYQLLSDNDALGYSLLEMRRNLQTTNRLKSAFLANMSHEIRTPLNGIVGLFNVLCEDPSLDLPDDYKQYSAIINSNTQQLLKHIDDILDASKIEAGQMVIHSEPVCLNSLMDEMYIFFKTHLHNQGKSHHIKLENANKTEGNDGSYVIHTDPVRLKQIMNNLMSNAIKFTDRGYIRFGYRLIKNNIVEFFVEDTGIGIPENQLDVIFQRFRQVELGNNRQYGGVGLGLKISRNLAQMMGGNVYATSIEGKGSRFCFTIVCDKISDDKFYR